VWHSFEPLTNAVRHQVGEQRSAASFGGEPLRPSLSRARDVPTTRSASLRRLALDRGRIPRAWAVHAIYAEPVIEAQGRATEGQVYKSDRNEPDCPPSQSAPNN
jgi:hypothetical protein